MQNRAPVRAKRFAKRRLRGRLMRNLLDEVAANDDSTERDGKPEQERESASRTPSRRLATASYSRSGRQPSQAACLQSNRTGSTRPSIRACREWRLPRGTPTTPCIRRQRRVLAAVGRRAAAPAPPSPIVASLGRSPMKKEGRAIARTDHSSACLRPNLSPIQPNNAPPIGRMRNPAANVP